ncbi:MAG: hypothetical protein IJV67_05270, partial [Clostridia bacterium]|nr:hypothetical protein [Clostridia bacterium]
MGNHKKGAAIIKYNISLCGGVNMAVMPIYEDFKFSEDRWITHDVSVDCKINGNDIKNIIAVTGNACAISDEIIESEINFSGRALFCVLYESIDGEVKKTECGVEFSSKVTSPEYADLVKFSSCSVNDIQTVGSGSSYSVTAMVRCGIELCCHRAVSVVTGGEGILCDATEREVSLLVDQVRSAVQVDKEFDLPYSVKDIVSHSAGVYINEVQSSVGNVILDGTVVLSFTSLQNSEKNVIVKENKLLPFRQEIELLSATPHLKSYANASVSKCMFKVVVDEEKNSSTVVLGCDLDVSACVYESKTLMLPRDVYSVTNEISIKKDVVQLSCPVACFSSSERVMGVTDVEIDDNADVVCVIAERVEGLSEIAENQNVVGSVCATVIFQDENGKLYGKEASLPFDVSLNVRPDGNYTVKAVIEGFNYRARSSVDFEVVIRFCFTE